jgi:multiple antibiotic resistance protein
MIEIILAVFAGLFSIVNPLGAVPVFLAMSPDFTVKERQDTALHASIYFTIILLVFFLAGTPILGFFGITLSSLRIAGGIIIFGSGAQLLSGSMAKSRAINAEVKAEALGKEDISFTPLAMPLLAGPGSISMMIGYFSSYSVMLDRVAVALAVVLVGILVYIILRTSPLIFRILGVAGIKAISRIMGFIVMAIGVELIISSIKQILAVTLISG